MKRIISGIIACILALTLVPTALAAEAEPLLDPGISIQISGIVSQPVNANGEPVYPVSYNGTTYVPVRGISYLFGRAVTWDQATHTVSLTDDPITPPVLKSAPRPKPTYLTGVRPDPGITIKYNGSVRQLTDANGKPVYPISYNGTTYIPVRGVAGLFGKSVSWNQATRTVVIEDAMRDITASDLVADIKIGTNHYRALGGIDWSRKVGYYNYSDPIDGLDKVSYLTLWGEGLTPFVPAQFAGERRVDMEFYDLERFDKVIQAFKDAGYNAVRLPVSWTLWTNDTSFEIDKGWLDLVEAAVKVILDKGMYCIINSHDDYMEMSWVGDHWEDNWMSNQYKPYVDARFASIWRQVAERFKSYDDHLLFESVNEPTDGESVNEINGYEQRMSNAVTRVNELNALFVKTVRETGGNNTKRFLSIPPLDVEHLKDMKLPDDDRLIVQVHYYFHHEDWSTVTSWSRNNKADTKQVDETFALIKQFIDQTGVPVILGEFGNTEAMPLSDRIDQATYVLGKATELGIPAFWWDCTIIPANDGKDRAFSLYNRDKLEWVHPEILKAMMQTVKKR